MHRRTNIFIVPITICLFVTCLAMASAQTPTPPGTLHASGQHEIKLAPQKLRLSMAIRAEGADAKSAIEAFVKHKERVKKELVEMKADEASIEISPPQLSNGVPGMPGVWTSYQPAVAFDPPPVPGQPAPVALPKTYTAVAHIKAEWPLPTTDSDALAMLPETLKEQITTRDLMGLKNKAKLDAAQQEKLEELQAAAPQQMAMQMAYSTVQEGQPFMILFVAKTDDAGRKQGIKAAYDRAVAEAELLAAATGHKLGDLVSLHCENTPSMGVGDVNSPYAAVANYPGANKFQSPGDAALSTDPGGLGIGIKVDVEFAISR